MYISFVSILDVKQNGVPLHTLLILFSLRVTKKSDKGLEMQRQR